MRTGGDSLAERCAEEDEVPPNRNAGRVVASKWGREERCVMRGPGYHFDRFGSYLGFIDPNGYYCAADGTCRGMVSEDGTLVDRDGNHRGRFDIQGQFWNE